jgi:hypothetical protein
VDESDQPDDRGPRHRHAGAPHDASTIGLDDFRLAVNDQAKSPPHRNHGEGLERGVEGETT